MLGESTRTRGSHSTRCSSPSRGASTSVGVSTATSRGNFPGARAQMVREAREVRRVWRQSARLCAFFHKERARAIGTAATRRRLPEPASMSYASSSKSGSTRVVEREHLVVVGGVLREQVRERGARDLSSSLPSPRSATSPASSATRASTGTAVRLPARVRLLGARRACVLADGDERDGFIPSTRLARGPDIVLHYVERQAEDRLRGKLRRGKLTRRGEHLIRETRRETRRGARRDRSFVPSVRADGGRDPSRRRGRRRLSSRDVPAYIGPDAFPELVTTTPPAARGAAAAAVAAPRPRTGARAFPPSSDGHATVVPSAVSAKSAPRRRRSRRLSARALAAMKSNGITRV